MTKHKHNWIEVDHHTNHFTGEMEISEECHASIEYINGSVSCEADRSIDPTFTTIYKATVTGYRGVFSRSNTSKANKARLTS